MRPVTSTAAKTTRPTPIISAAAVRAVRAALRMALSRASAPLARHASGAPDDAREQRHGEARGHGDAEEDQDRAAGHAEQALAVVARARDAVRDERRAAEREEHARARA